jgi:hypothetical protein
MRAIRDAIVNYEATWSAIENVLANHLETVQNCDVDAEKCGEVVGIITGEIVQVFAGGAAIKALGVTRVGRVAEGISLVAKEYARKSAQIANKATKLLFTKTDMQQVFNIAEKSLSCATKKLCAAQKMIATEAVLKYADKFGVKGAAAVKKIESLLGSSKNFGLSSGDEVKKFATNLGSPKRTRHILEGDSTGGGHMFPGKPEKTVFPKTWDGDKIMFYISDIVTDPGITWRQLDGVPGSAYTRAGKPARFEAVGTREGVEIRVVVEPAGEGIISGYPLSGPGVIRNPQ